MKTFNTMWMGGKIKYAVNFHDGVQKHKDGSNFFAIQTFKNKQKMKTFTDNLIKEGYKEGNHFA